MLPDTGLDAESILEESPDAVIVVDHDWRVTYANRAVEGVVGRPRAELIGETIWVAAPTLAGTAAESELRRAEAESRPAAFEHRDAGVARYYVVYAQPAPRSGLVIYLRDLTLQKLAEDAASATARKYRMVVEQASDGILVMDQNRRCLEANARLSQMLGYSQREILSRHYEDLIHPEDLAATPARLDELLTRGSVTTERRLLRKDGGVVVAEVGGSLLEDGRILTLFRDVTERKRAEEALRAQSVVDELTRVCNRRGFVQAAERELAISQLTPGRSALLILADLDNLKIINDTHGHAAGDDALVIAADALRDVVRASDIVGRWGGDEFIVFVSHGTQAALDAVRSRLAWRLETANAAGRPYTVSLSLGAAFSPPGGAVTLDRLIAEADAALYSEKRNRVRPARP